MSSATQAHPPGQPSPKAPPATQLSGLVPAQGDDEIATQIAEVERHKGGRQTRDQVTLDPCSLPPTLVLIQRILAPEKHGMIDLQPSPSAIEDILPPLTSSNDVDVELYAILAIIIKDLVNTWYAKITPDHVFNEEIIHIVAHCSRAIEQRLRKVDITALLLDELPLLVEAHYETYRVAKAASETYPSDLDARQVFHDLQPHRALTPLPVDDNPSTLQEQSENERAYRQLLVQGSLAVLLPTEDLQNGPLRILVGDIVADLILGQALSAKVCDGWFLHDAIHKVTALMGDKLQPKATGMELRHDAKSRLEEFGLLSSESNSQHLHSSSAGQSQFTSFFWRVLQLGYFLYLSLCYIIKELQALRSRPKRGQQLRFSSSSPVSTTLGQLQTPSPRVLPARPVLAFGILSLISTLLRMSACMPWATGMLAFWKHALLTGIGELDSRLDRLLYHAIETQLFPSSLLPLLLRNLRAALFPNNAMGPPAPPPPSHSERLAIKRKTAESIRALVPTVVARRYYATSDEAAILKTIEEDLLDPLDDIYLNKHLIFAILELILVRLIPELAEQSPRDLLVDRGVSTDDGSSLGFDDDDLHEDKRVSQKTEVV